MHTPSVAAVLAAGWARAEVEAGADPESWVAARERILRELAATANLPEFREVDVARAWEETQTRVCRESFARECAKDFEGALANLAARIEARARAEKNRVAAEMAAAASRIMSGSDEYGPEGAVASADDIGDAAAYVLSAALAWRREEFSGDATEAHRALVRHLATRSHGIWVADE